MKTITATELRLAMRAIDIDPSAQPQFWDVYYAIPTAEWVRNTLKSAWGEYLGALGIRGLPSVDCDDYAHLCWSYARFLHARSTAAKCGIAFGFYGYTKADTFAGHAINIAYTDQGIVWFEPQASKIIELDPAERMTCRFYAF